MQAEASQESSEASEQQKQGRGLQRVRTRDSPAAKTASRSSGHSRVDGGEDVGLRKNGER